MRIISAEQGGGGGGRFGVVEFMEADDGVTAVAALRAETAAGRHVDFVLMDFVMVGASIDTIQPACISHRSLIDTHARARGY